MLPLEGQVSSGDDYENEWLTENADMNTCVLWATTTQFALRVWKCWWGPLNKSQWAVPCSAQLATHSMSLLWLALQRCNTVSTLGLGEYRKTWDLPQDHGKHPVILRLQGSGKIYLQTTPSYSPHHCFELCKLGVDCSKWLKRSWFGNCYLTSTGLCKSHCNAFGKLMRLAGLFKKV